VNLGYSAPLSALDFTLTTPAGSGAWKVPVVSGPNIPQAIPGPDDLGSGGLGFIYTSIPANPASFTFTLTYPAGMSGSKTLACVAHFTDEATSVVSTLTTSITLTPPVSAVQAAQAIPSQALLVGTPATAFTPVTASGGTVPYTFAISPALPGALSFSTSTGAITGTPSTAFVATTHTVTVTDSRGTQASQSFSLSASSGLVITQHPRSATATAGSTVTVNVTATASSALTYQWRKNGVALAGQTNAALALANFQVTDVGSYSVDVTSGGTTSRSQSASIGLVSTAKAAGAAYEFAANIIHGVTGNTYDQVLLTGPAATVTADAGQITRISFVDLNDDIVQVEFSGAGALTLTLENPTGPASPIKYNQPEVQYMKGHASIFLTGADHTTNVSIFSVGPANAFNQALFPAGTVYDAVADVGLLSIVSSNGRFAGIRTANAAFFRATGLTGVYAPGVAIAGPTFVGDVSADADATGVLVFGSTTDVRITGGDLRQLNDRAVQVDGINAVSFTAGTKSNGAVLPVQPNRGRLERNGLDVTSQLVR
jgi:hypothetical protein